MSYASIDDLRSHLGVSPARQAYADKMLHPFPDGLVVKRNDFIVERCTGKRVMDFGASGLLHTKIQAVASEYMGVDREASPGVIAFDLDEVGQNTLPWSTDAEVAVCGEVLEHLTNPGWFLHRLRLYSRVPTIITVPNALGEAFYQHRKRGLENVNIDHVAWYSPRTLKTLLDRYAFTIREFAYYNGSGPDAEGLIAVVD